MQYAVWIALAVVLIAILPSLLKGKDKDGSGGGDGLFGDGDGGGDGGGD